MNSIVVFNNKGGVGKTTLLCNLASYLKIRRGKKVIVVDTDPQCNATAYMFPSEQIEDFYAKGRETVYDIIKPVQKGKGYSTEALPIKRSPNFRVDVLIGDPKLSLSEDFLSKDWLESKAGEFRGLQTTLLFKDLIGRLSEYDYVFFDVGPSLGALNRAVLAACDFFIVPMSSDIFSLQAIENIAISIKEWNEQLTRGLADYEQKESEPFMINNANVVWNLKFAGYITQQYTAKTVNGKMQPVNAYEKIIKKIPHTIEKYFHALNAVDLDYERIGEITNLHSLVPLSQNSSVPIFDLKGSNGVVGAHFNKVKEFEATLAGLADNLISNIDKLS